MLRAEMRSLLLISTIAAASAQAVFTDYATLKAAVRDPSCCDNGVDDEGGNTLRPASYNNSCTYNGVHIKDWDVSQITDFENMFRANHDYMCLMHFNADISKWNVSSGLSFRRMFQNAFAFNQDISGWRPQNLPANKFDLMFELAMSFNQKLDDWNLDVSRRPELGANDPHNFNIVDMFHNTYSLNHLPAWWYFYGEYGVINSCATQDNCGTCNQPKHPDIYLYFPDLPQSVTCNAGRLANYEGVDCRDQKCVDDNSLCCNVPCSAQTSASACKEASVGCWWNLDKKTCANTCSLPWKNEVLQQCSDTRRSCGEGTSNDNGVCKPACTSDGCIELVEAYKNQC